MPDPFPSPPPATADPLIPSGPPRPPAGPDGTSRRRTAGLLAALLLLVVLLVYLLVQSAWPPPKAHPNKTPADGGQASLVVAQQLSEASQALSERVRRSVVRVDAEQVETAAGGSDELAQLFGSGPSRAAWGQGSGVIVDAEGYILTNYHVVRSAERITVVLDGRRSFPARLVGADALTDLAVLKIRAEGLEPITWGDSDQLRVGAFVWAIGSPFGLEGSVSLGIVSATHRNGLSDSPFQEFMQTDAAIHPGNSGGPLVDSHGRLVGINTAILGQQFQGISFAIPSATAKDVYERLRTRGQVDRGWLGVHVDVVTPQRSRQHSAGDGLRGAYVVAVAGDPQHPSPAQQAGIRAGDILTHWNGQPIDGPVPFSRLVAQSAVGSRARLTFLRGSDSHEATVVVGARP